MNIKAVIVDDEYLARQRIIKLLEKHDEIDVVGEARNADQAVALIEQRAPDLVFLDVQMPGADGFSVIKRIPSLQMPMVIFTTAYDQYALNAFEVHAMDYLLKPFEQGRFDEAVTMALSQMKMKRSAGFNDQLMDLMKRFHGADEDHLTSLKLKEKGREVFVDINDIMYLETAGNYVVLHTPERQFLYRSTMNELEARLNPDEFLRIHRSFLLNKRFIRLHRYIGGNEFVFEMKNGKELQSAKSYKEAINRFAELHL